MDIDNYKSHLKRHGFFKTAFTVFKRSVNLLFTFKILYCIKLELNVLNRLYSTADDSFQITRLEPAGLFQYGNLEEYQMSKSFLDEVQRKGDICFGILKNEKLAAYGWYSNKPTILFEGDWEFNFGDECMYMYKVYTHPDYRGQRLAAIGMSNALGVLSKLGYKCLVGIVEVDNFSFIKSMSRMGWQKVGKFICIKIFKTNKVFSVGNNKNFGFELSAVNNAIRN